jgi:thiopeptide-type bacteriocin biosynthesis protein
LLLITNLNAHLLFTAMSTLPHKPSPPSFTTTGILRTPLLPIDDLLQWSSGLSASHADAHSLEAAVAADVALLRERLRSTLDRPEVREAIFVASMLLEEEIELWRQRPDGERGQKLERALVRYFSRMTTRPTPFGLFAGVSTIRLADRTHLAIAERERYTRHTRLDNGFIHTLVGKLRTIPTVACDIVLRPNGTLYRVGGTVRFAAGRLHNGVRVYRLLTLDSDRLLEATLERARNGATAADLVTGVIADTERFRDEADMFTEQEARDYLAHLVRHGVLVDELDPPVTGAAPLDAVLARLNDLAGCAHATDAMRRVRSDLQDLDALGLGVAPERYRIVVERLRRITGDGPDTGDNGPSNPFQVDMAKPAPGGTVGPTVLAEVARALSILPRLQHPESGPLDDFRARFSERYEDREVPLLEALDEELGVGLRGRTVEDGSGVPLLEGLQFPARPERNLAAWGRREAHLLKLLCRATQNGAMTIELGEEDLTRMAAPQAAELPDAFSVSVTVAARSGEAVNRGEFQLLFAGADGPSGARTSGRFCHLEPDILASVTQHLRAEERLRPDAVFAEVAHLPEGRVGNILSRPALREYEIPLLTTSGMPADRQIDLGDLTLQVEGGRLTLRSTRLQREVVPRLTTAHNYALGFSIYRFLCMMQHQGTSSVGWSWGPLESARFLPRVVHGRIVFALARWLVDDEDLAPLHEAMRGRKQASTPEKLLALRVRLFSAARALRERIGLPRFVYLAEQDNVLPVDFENVLSVDSFGQMLKSRSVVLREMWPPPEALLSEGPEGRYCHELVLSATRPALGVQPAAVPREHAAARTPRTFIPGSNCLYLKLYTGRTTADTILRDVVAPMLSTLLGPGAASRWFFIRYADPDPHVRLRFFGDPSDLGARVRPLLDDAVAQLVQQGLVWRVQHDTYQRELERYGGVAGMEPSEELFWIDSEAVLAIMTSLEPEELLPARWRLAMAGIDLLLADLGLDEAARLSVVSSARDRFGVEFGADSGFYKQVGERFRRHRHELSTLLAAPAGVGSLEPALSVLRRRSERIRPVAERLRAAALEGALRVPFGDLCASHVHMHVNRLLHATHRAQELVLYDLLRRHYESAAARSGVTPAVSATALVDPCLDPTS